MGHSVLLNYGWILDVIKLIAAVYLLYMVTNTVFLLLLLAGLTLVLVAVGMAFTSSIFVTCLNMARSLAFIMCIKQLNVGLLFSYHF